MRGLAFAMIVTTAVLSACSTPVPPGMVWIPGGAFTMGSDLPDAQPNEQPLRRVTIAPYWMDAHEVTNDEFAAFVAATNYKTLAERPVDWELLKLQVPPGTPKPPDEMLAPGALVFTPPDHAVPLDDVSVWWSWTLGADWRHPQGPSSTIDGKPTTPVVQIAFQDALAYCAWAKKRLPTEAEWEFAARGGLDNAHFVWGNESIDPTRCNYWQGEFPYNNTTEDGFARAAPVGSFAPNRYGLYDMAGNVWEWCSDVYRADPEERVHRGGSFLCNANYCSSYRPSARRGCTPDTALEHLGFRCVMDPK